MKTKEDFKKAIGEPDAAFEACVLHTISSLENEKTRSVLPARRMLIAAAVLLMLTVVAGAAIKNWDLGAFLRYNERNVGETVKIPAFEAENWSNQWAEVRVKELRHDGFMLYSVYEISPKKKDTLLLAGKLPADDQEAAQLYLNSSWQTGEGSYSEETAAEYIGRTGAEMVFVSINDFAGTDRFVGEQQAWRADDGVLTVYSAQMLETDAAEIECSIHLEMQKWTVEGTAEAKETKTLFAKLPSGQIQAELVNQSGAYYDRYGVRLIEAKIISTELGTLLYTRHIVEEPEKCSHFSPTFEFARGMNITRKFWTSSFEDTDGSVSSYSWWGVLEKIPEAVTLEILHLDSHEIKLEQIEKKEKQG